MERLLRWLVSRLFSMAIHILYKTARIRTIGEERVREYLSGEKKILFCFFHGDYLLLFPQFRGRNICIFTTQSKRGELLAEIMRIFGYRPSIIPGKSGNHSALDWMAREIQKGCHAGIVVDGPMGPYRKVKHGAVILAKRTGHMIIGVGIASSWRVTVKKRWDRYTIPLPFTRSVMVFGEPVHVPSDADAQVMESFRQQVEEDLVKLNRIAEEHLTRQPKVRAL